MNDHRQANSRCWICGGQSLTKVKDSSLSKPSAQSFRITDSSYGVTAAIFRCEECSFLQCPELNDVVRFYEQMDDAEYEKTRSERGIQARKILECLAGYRPSGKLLDIGSGAGILVEQALGLGYDARGVDPSRWLQARAQERGLPVTLGVFPHPEIVGPFDLITVIDVLEHVEDPMRLLQDVRAHLSKDGLAVIVTPDVQSVAARLLGFRWWHYRMAHIGYFSRTTLTNALRRAGLIPKSFQRPSWYFPASYLVERVGVYLPRPLRLRVPGFLSTLLVPLNLRDSMLVVAQAK